MLDPNSPLPLYHQLADWLAEQIRLGKLAAGDRLPSEHELAARFGVGRPTVRQATDVLVRRGAVERRRGAGTFVRAGGRGVDLFSLGGTRSAFAAQGLDVRTQVLSALATVEVPAAQRDNPFAGQQALMTARINKLDRVPVLLEYIYLCPELFAPLSSWDFSELSLSDAVRERLLLRPLSADQRFSVVPVRGRPARALKVASGTGLLFVQRTLHFPQRRDAVFVELYCCTDRMVFSQTIQGEDDV